MISTAQNCELPQEKTCNLTKFVNGGLVSFKPQSIGKVIIQFKCYVSIIEPNIKIYI